MLLPRTLFIAASAFGLIGLHASAQAAVAPQDVYTGVTQ